MIALFLLAQGWLEYDAAINKKDDLRAPLIADILVMVCVDLAIFFWYLTIVFRLMSQAERQQFVLKDGSFAVASKEYQKS